MPLDFGRLPELPRARVQHLLAVELAQVCDSVDRRDRAHFPSHHRLLDMQQLDPAGHFPRTLRRVACRAQRVLRTFGTFLAGWLADAVGRAGSSTPLKWVLLSFDGLNGPALFAYLVATAHLHGSARVGAVLLR